jgi:hypothetical protein
MSPAGACMQTHSQRTQLDAWVHPRATSTSVPVCLQVCLQRAAGANVGRPQVQDVYAYCNAGCMDWFAIAAIDILKANLPCVSSLVAAAAPSGIGAFAYSTSGAPHAPRGYSPGPYPYPPPMSPGMPVPGDNSAAAAAAGFYGESLNMHSPLPSGRISSGYPGPRASPEPAAYGLMSPGRHVEVLVNAHEGELSGLRTAVGRLDAERRLAAVATGQVGATGKVSRMLPWGDAGCPVPGFAV